MNFTSKQIWLINYPVMMSVLVEQLINITDAIFLGHVGETELGASAIAGMYYLSLYILGFGFSLGLQVMIARRNGEQRPAETGKVFFQGLLFLTTLAATLFGLSKIFTPFILQRLLTSPEIYKAVIQYLDWRTLGLLFAFPMLAFRAFFVGITRTRILTVSAVTLASMNVLLNYLLIFGTGKISAQGISGAAMAIHDLRTGRITRAGQLYSFQNRQTTLRPPCHFLQTTHGTTFPPIRLEHDALLYQCGTLVPFLYSHRTSRYHAISNCQYHPEYIHDLLRHREFLFHHHGITRQ